MATITHAGTAVWTTTAGNKTFTGTPAIGDLIVVVAPTTGASSAPTTAVTDNNADGLGTYTKIGSSFTGWSAGTGGGNGDLSIWVRNAKIGSATSTVFTAAQASSNGGGLDVFRVSGMYRTGANAVRSSGGQNVATGTAGTTPAPALSLTPLTGNPIITAVCNGTNPGGVTGPSTYTAPTNLGYNTPTSGLDTAFINSGITNATITWGSTSATAYGSIAIELDTSAPVGPVFEQAITPIRAAFLPKPRLAGVYMGASPPPQNPYPIGTPWTPPTADMSFGTGQVQWNAGGPVSNPNIPGQSGPPLGWSSPAGVRVVIVRTGLCMSTYMPVPVSNPAPPSSGAPVYPLHGPVQARFPQPHRGRIAARFGAPLKNPGSGPVFHAATSPCRAKIPQNIGGGVFGSAMAKGDSSFGSGHVMWSPGAPVRNPAPGPVFRQRTTPVRFVIPPPPPSKGRIGTSFTTQVQIPVHGPPVYALPGPVQARFPQPHPRAGRVESNPGAPLQNPAPGPVFRQKPYPVQARDPLPRKGRVYSTAKPVTAAVTPPAPLFPLTSPVRAKLPQHPLLRGRMASTWGMLQNPGPGPAVYPLISPVRARFPLPLRGRIASSPGTLNNPVTGYGPVFRPRRDPARSRIVLPPRGRISFNPGAPVHNPAPGPVFRQAVRPVQARRLAPPKGKIAARFGTRPAPAGAGPVPYARISVRAKPGTFLKGRIASNPGGPLANPVVLTPPATSIGQPAGIRVIFLATGRVQANKGAPVSNPVPVTGNGPVFYPRTSPAKAAGITLPRRGACRAIRFGPVAANPGPGPVFTQATSPARARITPPPRGRVYSNPGGPLANPVTSSGPVFVQRSFIRAQQPLPRRGTCRTIKFGPAAANPGPGPVFTQAVTPARARITPPPRGRVYSNPGGPLKNPVPPAIIIPKALNVQARFPLAPRGRIYSGKGGPLQNPGSGPAFRQATQPARIRVTLPPRGRIVSARGVFGNPVISSGPVFRPADQPIQARIPQNGPRGRIAFSKGTLRNPGPGPVFTQAVHPAQARIPQVFSKGRVYSNPGGPLANPVTQSPLYPLKSPVRAHPVLPPRGRIASGAGVRVLPPPPVYPLQHPVRAQFPLPTRGRTSGNPGGPVAGPGNGPKVYPAKGPVQARRPLPPKGRITLGNPGAPVRNPASGPVFRQAVRPIQARIPQNAPRGRTTFNPGGPVVNPRQPLRFRYGSPYFQWTPEEPYFPWQAGEPVFQWATGDPYLDWG